MKKNLLLALCCLTILVGCDPMARRPTPETIVVTNTPTSIPTIAPIPTATRTPPPTITPDFTPTPTPFPCEEDGQVIEIDTFRSEIANENVLYNVYIPPCYAQSTRRFPVIYLLHEQGFTASQWIDVGLAETFNRGIRLGVLPPAIVVMPALGNIGARNQFPPNNSYETVLLDELFPEIENNFCTWEDVEYRALGGIGRGGFWAFSIGMRFPDIISSIGAHSGVFPDSSSQIPAQFNPLEIARNSTFLPEAELRYYMDNAADDDEASNQQILSDRLTGRQIPHTYIINPIGAHNNDYWSAHLSEYLDFYGEGWALDYNELPSCLEPSP